VVSGDATRRVSAWVVAAAVGSLAALVAVGPSTGALRAIPNPCAAVPGNVVAKALGLKKAPVGAVTDVPGIETCNYPGIKLTIAVGSRALPNPAPAKTTENVSGLPHGRYTTYAGSKASQVFFYTGSAATGVFAVLRNYGTIRKSKLEGFAKLLYASMKGATASGAPSGPTLVGN
jgi:hypothetical protein